MQQHARETSRRDKRATTSLRHSFGSLQVVLWTLWTLAVVATANLSWRADLAARRALNVLGLVIHCGLVGVIGLVVVTIIEMRLESWRFHE